MLFIYGLITNLKIPVVEHLLSVMFLIFTLQTLLKRNKKALRKPFGCWMAAVHIIELLCSRLQSICHLG